METLLALVIFSVLGAGVVAWCLRGVAPDERAWLRRILVFALFLRLAAATMFALFPGTRLFHDDADGYEWIGMWQAASWHSDLPPPPQLNVLNNNTGFYFICAAIYYLVGPLRAAASYFNCLAGTASVFLVYRLAREFFHPVVARRATVLTAFVPSMVLWSSIAIKDPVMVLLILISLVGVVRLKRRYTTADLMICILPIFAVLPIRFYMFYVLIFSVLGSLAFERGTRFLSAATKQIVIGSALVLVVLVLGLSGAAQQGTEYMSLEKISTFRNGMATTANSGFSAEVDISTPGGALAFMPIGMAMLLLSPFPWQMTSLRAALTLPEMLVWWWLIPSLIRGLRLGFKERFSSLSPLFLFSAVLIAAYSLVHGNIGSGFRQRAQIFVLLFIFASLGLYAKKCKQRGIDPRQLFVDSKPGETTTDLRA